MAGALNKTDGKLDLTYTTRVRIEIEVSLGQAWSPQETAENAFRSSVREAETYLRNLAAREKFRVVGEPQVLHIVAERRRS